MNNTATFLGGLVVTLMLVWPIVVNSQPGTQFIYLGIDWKADNLDGTLFWTALVLLVINATLGLVNEKLQSDKRKKENSSFTNNTRFG